MTFIIRSKALDADSQDLQDAESRSGLLTGLPKLTFARNANGDTITRNEGTWDRDDGFSVGERIAITGALNAGHFTIANIANAGQTLVLDVSNTVSEIVTKALAISGAVDAPEEELSPDDSAEEDSPVGDSLTNCDNDPDKDREGSSAPPRESPDESADSDELSWLFADSPADNSQSSNSQSGNSRSEDAQAGGSLESESSTADLPKADAPIGGDDATDAGHAVTGAPDASAPTNDAASVEASRQATHAPGRAIRSRSEIEKLLIALSDEHLTVTAYPEDGELLFAARVRAVDPDLGRIVLEYSQWKPANSALLASRQVLFHCERKNRHIQFLAGAPSEIVFGGSAGIQVGFPEFILDLQQRTERRFRLATRPSMWCVIKQDGGPPIVANVDDISKGGLGGIVHDPGVVLKPGMIVKNCQITGSELKRPIDVSVEIRYWKTVRSKEGVLSKRVGCRFVASSADLQKLIDVFIVDLDDDQPGG